MLLANREKVGRTDEHTKRVFQKRRVLLKKDNSSYLSLLHDINIYTNQNRIGNALNSFGFEIQIDHLILTKRLNLVVLNKKKKKRDPAK